MLLRADNEVTLKKQIFWLKNRTFRPAAMSAFREALKNQSASAATLDDLNWTKRKQVVQHAYATSKFYRNLYDRNGFNPADLERPDDWLNVPILEKDHLRNFRDEILIRSFPRSRLITSTTGGSTGVPVKTHRDRAFPEEILKWRMLARWGVSPADDILMLWRVPPNSKGTASNIRNAAMWWPTRRYKFDVSDLDNKKLAQIADILVRKRPPIIWGYVGALEEVAIYLQRVGVFLEHDPLVWATASPMSNIQRALFSDVFGARILDQYACSEIHWIASSTPKSSNLIVDYDYRHVELERSQKGPKSGSEYGELLLTDLQNFVFPLIRYRNGDRARFVEGCRTNGYPFPVLSPVKGRISDTIRAPSGKSIPGEYLTTIFDDDFDLIKQFSTVQKRNYSVTVEVVPRATADGSKKKLQELLERTKANISEKLGGEVHVDAVLVDRISSERGKIRFIRSDVAGPLSG